MIKEGWQGEWGVNAIGSKQVNQSTFKMILLKNVFQAHYLKVAIRQFLSISKEIHCCMCLEPISHNLVIQSTFLTYDKNIIAGFAELKNVIIFAIW